MTNGIEERTSDLADRIIKGKLYEHFADLDHVLTAFAKEEVKRALPESEKMAAHFDECAGEADVISKSAISDFVRDSSRASAAKFRRWAETIRTLKESTND